MLGLRLWSTCIILFVLGSCFGGGTPLGGPRNRWEDAIQRDAANLLRIRDWKAEVRERYGGVEEGWGGHGPKKG
jgi:hypothetical protein